MDHPQTRRSGNGESIIGAVHRDVLYEILLRVPAKPLHRFRTVCQSWRSLLSSPSFVAAHTTHHHQPLLAVCDWVPGSGCKAAELKLLDTTTTSGRAVRRFDLGQESLLLRVWSHLDLTLIVRSVDDHHHCPLTMLDTSTGTVSILPGGYYDDTRSSFVFGRAASSSSSKGGDHGEYKVLSVNNPLPLNRYATRPFYKILTVVVDGGGGAWRDAPPPPVAIKTFHSGETVVASGVVYHLVDRSNGWTIAAFDLEAEQWLPDLLHGPAPAVPGQPASINATGRRSLAAVNMSLAAIHSTSSAIDLWLLMGSGEKAQWCKRCRVHTWSMEEQRYRLSWDPVPLWVLDDGRVAFWLRGGIFANGTLWMYNPRTQACTLLSSCLKIGASGYTGSLLRQRQQVRYAHGTEEL